MGIPLASQFKRPLVITGLSDGDAIAKAHILYSERKSIYEGFEVWDRTRVAIRHPDPYAKGDVAGSAS